MAFRRGTELDVRDATDATIYSSHINIHGARSKISSPRRKRVRSSKASRRAHERERVHERLQLIGI